MSRYTSLSDFDLITLLRNGDQVAYTEIFNRYHYLMFVFAYKKVRDEDMAKDFVQDLFTKIWHKREMIKESGNFTSFLYTSLMRKIIDYFTHQKVGSKYIDYLAGHEYTNKSEGADYLIREKQLHEYIDSQIEMLPKKMREIFLLSRKQHLTHKEIAFELDTTEHNVSRQITNALQRLRKKLPNVCLSLLSVFP